MKVNPLQNFNLTYHSKIKSPQKNNHNNQGNQSFLLFDNYFMLLNKSMINFKGKEDNFSVGLERLLNRGDENELFDFLLKKLNKKAQEKGVNNKIIDDVVQSTIVEILVVLQDFNDGKISKDELIKSIEAIYENIKANKSDYVSDFRSISLDTPILDDKKTIQDIIADDEKYKVRYLSTPDEEKRKKYRIEVDKALDGACLKDKEKEILSLRFKDDRVNSYESIAQNHNVSNTTVRNIFKRAIYKIQIKNNTLSDEVKNNIIATTERFKKEGLTVEDYTLACLRQPQLFTQSPEKTEENVRSLVEKFEKEGLTVESYLQACLRRPSIFCQSPETIENNIKGLVEKFENDGLTIKEYLSACLRQPQLFYQSPETFENNVKGLIEKFENEGLTIESYIPACLRRPQLFTQSPETIENNVRSLVKKFEKEGLSVKNYLPACLKQPQLFARSPETLENNIKSLVKKFENDGLTIENYLSACLKQPSLFYQTPETIENNIKSLVKKFENGGLTIKKYIPTCLKQPQLFIQSPETIENHIKALIFIKKNIHKKWDLRKIVESVIKKPRSLSYKNETNYSILLRNKMFGYGAPKSVLGNGRINQKLIDYLRENPNSKFSFSIIDDPMSQEFIEYAKNLAYEAIKKDDVFDIRIT